MMAILGGWVGGGGGGGGGWVNDWEFIEEKTGPSSRCYGVPGCGAMVKS